MASWAIIQHIPLTRTVVGECPICGAIRVISEELLRAVNPGPTEKPVLPCICGYAPHVPAWGK